VKRQRGCADCGFDAHPDALQLDHVPGWGDKKFNFSKVAHRGRDAVDAELAKCEVRCANCHMIRTAERRSSEW
jgi:hypothetical protein